MANWLGDLSMNINKLTGGTDTSSKTRSGATEAVPGKQDNNSKAQETAKVTDQVKLSASSKSIQQIEAEIRDMPEVDDATVDRIRNAIQTLITGTRRKKKSKERRGNNSRGEKKGLHKKDDSIIGN